MSYTSSDPENTYRDPDTSSLASTSTTASQLSKSSKKKPWSKLKSGIKSLGRKMSTGSKPTFAEPTESSEQKKVKKNKKFKESGSGSEVKPSTSEVNREKSPSKGTKSLIKRLSVESLSTPFVGYQPSSVSPTRTYAKAVYKSASTSESNLSTSDMDTPKKSSTLDKNTKFSLDSPDSGRVSRSQGESSSRPPSQITEEGYVSNSDTDSTGAKTVSKEGLGLVAKTQHFAQTVIPPKRDKDVDVSVEFIKAETLVKPPKSPSPDTKTHDSSKVKETEKQTSVPEKDNPVAKTVSKKSDVSNDFPAIDEVEGRRKNKNNKKRDNTSASFLNSERSEINNAPTSSDTKLSQNNGDTVTSSSSKKQDKKNTSDFPNTRAAAVAATKPVENVQDEKSKTENNPDTAQKAENPVKPTSKVDDKSLGAETSKQKSADEKSLKETGVEKQKSDTDNKPEKSEALPIIKKQDTIDENRKKESNPKKEEKRKSPNDNEQKKTSKNSKDTSEPTTVPSLADFGPSTPSSSEENPTTTQMSVEEKLEAFLSAEGWSGTIKDIADKTADGDGTQQADKRECLYKILVIGELGTGKTSIIKRYVHQFFSQHYRATIGVDFALKVLNWDTNTIIRLQLWDIAGQERFGNMTRVYYKEAVGAFIVFDVTRSATFDAVLKWKQDLDSKVQLADGSPIPCVLLANKCDQQKEGLVNTPSKMDEYCKENNFSAWFETSAKENINIDDAAKSLVSQILQNDRMSQNGRDSVKDGSKFPLENKSEDEGRTCSC